AAVATAATAAEATLVAATATAAATAEATLVAATATAATAAEATLVAATTSVSVSVTVPVAGSRARGGRCLLDGWGGRSGSSSRGICNAGCREDCGANYGGSHSDGSRRHVTSPCLRDVGWEADLR
ncbi:hypothetical protein ABZV61_21350, partial [Streptomyces sp900116325]